MQCPAVNGGLLTNQRVEEPPDTVTSSSQSEWPKSGGSMVENQPDSAADDSEAAVEDLPTKPDDYLSPDDRRELQRQLESISRKRREAESDAQNLRIG